MPSVEASLFPFISSPTVLQHTEAVCARIRKLAPDLRPLGCERLLRELSLLARAVDLEDFYVRREVEASARRIGILI